jgi:hypothetical protein
MDRHEVEDNADGAHDPLAHCVREAERIADGHEAGTDPRNGGACRENREAPPRNLEDREVGRSSWPSASTRS